jgi:c-di-GMP-binding flagellar brake protein YcgR
MSSQPGKALKRANERRQRRFPRYRSEFPVSLTLFSGGQQHSLEAHCRDLSTAGIGILVAEDLGLGEVVALSFSLPGRSLWKVRAVLRHRRGYHYGFEFLSLSGEQSKALAEYLPAQSRADSDSNVSFRKK